jgi:hypothetical protein
MGKARGEGSRYFVIYSDPLRPLDSMGWPIEQAFGALLEQCGYAASWDVKQTATLSFRHVSGPHEKFPVGLFALVDHPHTFSADIIRGNNGENMARQNIMHQVLRVGLNGWRGATRENFSHIRGIAERRLRNPELFPPKSD